MASEVGVAYVNIIPKTDGFSSSVAEASEKAGSDGAKSISGSLLDGLKGTFGDLFSTGGEMGGKLAGGMESFLSGAGKVAVVTAVAAIAVEALSRLQEIGAEIDAMTDSIIVGTGASGDALEGLRENAMGVATEVPVGFAKSGDIIQDFATRLGLSGDELQNVATRAAQLDHIIGGINYDKMATMFNVWGVGADSMNAKMDYMFGVSQNTGIGFDKLTSIMQSAGPTLQNLGFSFEESANMAGLLDKAGIDASSTMSKMSKALVNLSKPGENAQDAFRRVVGEMQNYIDAGDTASAMDLATELFGTRGAAQFIGALQSGALNMDKLSDSALGATGSIEDTFNATKSWPEQWELIQTRVQAALEPLGSAVFSTLGSLLEGIGAAMDTVWRASEPLRVKIGEIADGLGARLQPIIEQLSPVFSALADGAVNALCLAFQGLATIIGFVADTISAFVDFVTGAFSTLSTATGEAFGFIEQTIGEDLQNAQTVGSEAVNGLTALMRGDFNAASQHAKNVFTTIYNSISSKISAAKSFVANAVDSIGNALGFRGLGDKVRSVFDSIGRFIRNPIESARNFLASIPGQIVSFFSGLGSRISSAIGSIHFPSPHVSWSSLQVGPVSVPLPTVQWYATGGFLDQATIIGAGEAGPEMVLPKSGRMMDEFAGAVTDEIDMADVVDEIRAFRNEIGPIIRQYTPGMTVGDLVDRLGPNVTRRMAGGLA